MPPSGIRPLSGVDETITPWYWYPRIPLGALTLVFGRAGIGKSTMVYDVLARASRGDVMPNSAVLPDEPILNARSVIVGTEDTPERVRAVLEKADADLDNVAIVAQEQLPDPRLSVFEQLPFLEDAMKKFRSRVLYVDNVNEAMIGGTIDTNNERSVRNALRPLDSMAKRNDFAVIMTTHPKKGAYRFDVTEGITGSQAFTNLARSILFVARVPHSDVVGVAVAKSNYYPAERVNTLQYRMISEPMGFDPEGHEILGVPSLDWRGRLPYTAQELSNLQAEEAAEIARKAGSEDGY